MMNNYETEIYRESDLLRVAKRYNNSKRQYLLINPLQGKHMPVSPNKALAMMNALGRKLYSSVPDAKCIIGFAETATAIGAAAAWVFPDDVFFVHTTREYVSKKTALYFSEEHSHASEQKINTAKFSDVRSGDLILLDDEISTGRTMENIISVLSKNSPFLLEKGCWIGSVINRVTEKHIDSCLRKGIRFISLLRTERNNLDEEVSQYEVYSPEHTKASKILPFQIIKPKQDIPDLRCGATVKMIKEKFIQFAEETCCLLSRQLQYCKKVLFLGTEECMFPALCIAAKLERQSDNIDVYCHATTRSPIGICCDLMYPVQNGVYLESFYESERETFLYNLQSYDAVIVVTDSKNEEQCSGAMFSLMSAFSDYCSKFICVKATLN